MKLDQTGLKKAIWPESTIFSKLARCQWVNIVFGHGLLG